MFEDGRCDDEYDPDGLPQLRWAGLRRRPLLRGVRGRAARPARADHARAGHGHRADGRAEPVRPAAPRPRPVPAAPAAARSAPTGTARPAAPRPPSRGTTSASSLLLGWPPCAIEGSGTAATRTPWRSLPTQSRAAGRCWWSVTGSARRSTPTWPAWPLLAPHATYWRSGTLRAWGPSRPAISAVVARLKAAADAASDAVLENTRRTARTRRPARSWRPCSRVACWWRVWWATAARTGSRTTPRPLR